ncbi:hypothetical protein CKO28_09105 [Rhodovibrio sodomensis]|uniref:AAA domain-containing protein n=1 Tax=Rhodovibrio sodomensis TaxID=1088 RepID=A0ABS1DE86_9PROT|nr:hypothetical protein [Rhodovibrio sodomensis]MBK1668194.1 hypothetical protein [Rhodovibrio sodomensis]
MKTLSLLAYLRDAEDRAALELALSDFPGMAREIREGDVANATADAPAWTIIPEFLVLDVSASTDIEAALADLVAAAPEGDTNVIAVGCQERLDIYRRLRRMGVSEYAVSPIDPTEFRGLLNDIRGDRLSQGRAINPDRLIVTHAVRGGAGASSIAACLAEGVTRDHGKRALLLDLDIEGGSHYLTFGVEPAEGFLGMLETPKRIDALYLDRAMRRPSLRLSLLSTVCEVGPPEVDPASIDAIILQAQRAFDYVLVDLPCRALLGRELLAKAGHIVLVAPPTVLGLRDTLHTLNYIQANGGAGNVLVVVAKTGEYRNPVSENEFQQRTGCATLSIAFDPRAAEKTQVQTQTLLDAQGPIARQIEQLLARMPSAPQKKKRSFLSRLVRS